MNISNLKILLKVEIVISQIITKLKTHLISKEKFTLVKKLKGSCTMKRCNRT